jgi:peptide deformylase
MVPSGAVAYTFSNGSATVSPSSNDTYSVTGTSAEGCVSLPAVSQITVNPLPNVSISSSPAIICSGETATLTASGALSYSWSAGGNDTSIIINPTIATQYAVTGSDANGCVSTFSVTQQVDVCLGLATQIVERLKLYPNPTYGELTLETEQPMELIFTNCLGHVVLKSTVSSGVNQIQINDQAKGVYILTVRNDQFSSSHKIIKQ